MNLYRLYLIYAVYLERNWNYIIYIYCNNIPNIIPSLPFENF